MAENTRKDPRAKVLSMTVRYKSATLDEFIEHHSHDVSRGGMYIKTPQPFPPGTLLKFEVKIAADQKVMQGVGRVVWRREADEASADHPAGMGVKFIKLDTESKDIIDQLVTARMGDISAFDEVEPESEAALSAATFEAAPGKVAKDAGSEGFFPKSDDFPQPAPEDRTVMKQATELLQEALREVGRGATGSTPPDKSGLEDEVIPKAPRVASVTPSPARVGGHLVPKPESELTPRMQKTPAPATTESKPEVKTVSGAKQVSKAAASPIAHTPPPAQVKKSPTSAATESEPALPANAGKGVGGFQPVKPESVPSTVKKPGREAAPMTVPASPMATRRVAQADAAPKMSGGAEDYKIPMRQSVPAERGTRIGIILAVVAVAAGAFFFMSRKPEAVPPPASAPTPSVSEKVESAPVVLNLTGKVPDAGLAPSTAASVEAAPAAPSASAAPAVSAEKPAAPAAASVAPAPKVRQVAPRRRKADAGASAAPSPESPDELYPPTAPKTGSDTTESTPSTNTKSKSKTAPTPAPTVTEESPL